MENNSKAALLREIQVCQFAVIEANLYLDTHPCDQEALEFYRCHREKLRELLERWERVCGKIREDGGENLRWAWVENPWPWQVEG
ncbi:MAG: spore coat protein CotJB [Oscillospiraceae bacterium]|nr:spore coat protein CotJB [Oscillospiraceae bacterium]